MSTELPNVILTYPHRRPPLSDKMQSIYVETYETSRNGRSALYKITQWLESWMHKKVAHSSKEGLAVLELGAGTLNQLPYEKPTNKYDIVEPFRTLFREKQTLSRVRAVYDDIMDIPDETKYDRIISIATLEHIETLPSAVAKTGLMLNEGGTFCAGIPSEGGFLWGFSWQMSVGLAFRLRTGLDYGELMRHEHVNNAQEIIEVVRYFYGDVSVSRFPFPHHQLSLYAFICASKPNQQRCKEYIIDK
jgi:hypothetical protein